MFPISGWLVARITGLTESGPATTFLNDFSFAGVAIVGVIILAASYFAANDSNLFGSCMALESLRPLQHRLSVTILAIVGALTAGVLSLTDSAKALESIAALNCVLMPTPTVIMLVEWLLQEKVFRRSCDFASVPAFAEMPSIRWPATISLLAGFIVGIATAGLIPALEPLHVGVCPLQAWLTAGALYAILRAVEYARDSSDREILAAVQQDSEQAKALVKSGL
jgi:purine-cytosine permease-like protein